MPDLTVCITARNEEFLNRTIADVLAKARADTDVVAVLDGQWPVESIPDHPNLQLLHTSVSRGQRVGINQAVALSRARFMMKLDAHCIVDEGFDVKLLAPYDDGTLAMDVTTIPRMYNLHAFDWQCDGCGTLTYQGPKPDRCQKCPEGGTFTRVLCWKRRESRRSDFWRFDADLKFQYWDHYGARPAAQEPLPEVMSSIGACWVMARDRYLALGGLDEGHGPWGQVGTEVACKSWLSGGRQVTNRGTWFAHLFRTQRGFSFPYPMPERQAEHARAYSQRLWREGRWPGAVRPLSWLVDHFAPVPGWEAYEQSSAA